MYVNRVKERTAQACECTRRKIAQQLWIPTAEVLILCPGSPGNTGSLWIYVDTLVIMVAAVMGLLMWKAAGKT